MFRLDPDADIAGTHYLDEVNFPPLFLVERFGPPDGGDDYKVSGMYVFVNDAGDVFTVYDWKCTSLYDDGAEDDDESSFPTPEEFWGNWNPETLHIGGRGENRAGPAVAAFKQWLLGQYREYRPSRG